MLCVVIGFILLQLRLVLALLNRFRQYRLGAEAFAGVTAEPAVEHFAYAARAKEVA